VPPSNLGREKKGLQGREDGEVHAMKKGRAEELVHKEVEDGIFLRVQGT